MEAQPPGKRIASLNMLSGGERSLTAVALLFALLSVNPAPFCVLDEVDAALDEANVNRFTAALLELAAKTQFLVVTHNRRTVESRTPSTASAWAATASRRSSPSASPICPRTKVAAPHCGRWCRLSPQTPMLIPLFPTPPGHIEAPFLADQAGGAQLAPPERCTVIAGFHSAARNGPTTRTTYCG